MKLARPDVFHPRIVIAGASRGGDDELAAALRGRGLHAAPLAWDDPDVLEADLVIVGAGADTTAPREDFLAWTRTVRNLLNAPEVMAWNAQRRYLGDLQSAGVPTSAAQPGAEVTALVFVGGGRSHAFDAAGAGGTVEPDFEVWDLGRAALRAAAERLSIWIDELLYARADVVGDRDDARLLSLDLIAPDLGWRHLGAVERAGRHRQFALAVEAALQRLGLGPLSHRGP